MVLYTNGIPKKHDILKDSKQSIKNTLIEEIKKVYFRLYQNQQQYKI